MSNRDDEYYVRDRGDRRPVRRSDDRYDDRYDRGRSRRDDEYEGRRSRQDDGYDERRSRRDDGYDSDRGVRRSNGSGRRSDERYDGRREGRYDEREVRRRSSSRDSSGASSGSRGGGRGSSSNGGHGSGKGGSGKKNNTKAVILLVVEMLVACVLVFVAYTLFFKVDVTKVGKVNLNEEAITQSISENVVENEQMAEYTNIALFGVDARDGQLTKNTRSDTIIIASINNKTGDVKLCSVYRDTYLNLSNDKYNKCNVAYAQGGPEQAISMLNMNLDMDIKDFITIGFRGLTDVVDALGGVTINVTDSEISHLNNYQSTMAQELKLQYTPVTSSGVQTLNGLQTTAYCRIRYTAGDDFRRAERQRTVLMACLEKAHGMSYSQLETVANSVFGETYTSLDLSEILELLSKITNYTIVDSNGFPYEEMRTTGTMGKYGSCVLAVDLQSNVKWLHGFLFGDSEYEVSSDVQKYSEIIKGDVGKYLSN